ncbi:transposase [Streptomyces rhizosphaerihabitans]|nr:transposase [Streptomyces rhizosphaerihabitans]
MIVWDNRNVHRTAGLRQGAADHNWLTIFQLPSYAPDMNPAEDVWSLLRRGPLANTAFTEPETPRARLPSRTGTHPTTLRPHQQLSHRNRPGHHCTSDTRGQYWSSASPHHLCQVGPDAVHCPLSLRCQEGADVVPFLNARAGADLDHPGSALSRIKQFRSARADLSRRDHHRPPGSCSRSSCSPRVESSPRDP